MPGPPPSTEYSIAALSKLSGVSCHVLRAWERRYGFPMPHRSAANQRRYTTEQVQAVKTVAEMVRSSRAVGEVIAEFCAAGPDPEPHPAVVTPASASTRLVDALFAGDLGAADAVMSLASSEVAPIDLVVGLLEPALIEIGERWFNKEAGIYQEHFATGIILRALGRSLDLARLKNPTPRRRAIVASMQGERHEGGVLILGTALESSGWRAIALGVDVPVGELGRAVEAWKPDAVGVSFILSRNVNKRFAELATLRDVPVFVGGRSLMNYSRLARRYGLIPLPGPICSALPIWDTEFERWTRSRTV